MKMKKILGLLTAGVLSAATAVVLLVSVVNGSPADKPGMIAGDTAITTVTTAEIGRDVIIRPEDEVPPVEDGAEPEPEPDSEVTQPKEKVEYTVYYYHADEDCIGNNNGNSATAEVEKLNYEVAAKVKGAWLLKDGIGRMDPVKRKGSKGGDPILTAQVAVQVEKNTHGRIVFFEDLGECNYTEQNQMSNRIKKARWLLLEDKERWHNIVLQIEDYYKNQCDLVYWEVIDGKIQFWIVGEGNPDTFESCYSEFAGTNVGAFKAIKIIPKNPEDDIAYLLTDCGYQGTDIPGVPPDTPDTPHTTPPRITTPPPTTTTKVSTTVPKTTTTPKRTTSTSKRTTTVTTKTTTTRTTLQTKDPNLGPITRPGSVDTNVDTELKTRPRPTTVITTVKPAPVVTQPKVTKPNVPVNPEGTQNKPLQTDKVPAPVDTGPANGYIDPDKGNNKFG